MPPGAFALFLTFVGVAIAAGVVTTWQIGPRGARYVVLPIVAAFAALYLVGHRLGLHLGPTISLFGYDVALVFDVALALVAAGLTARLQRAVLARRRPAAADTA